MARLFTQGPLRGDSRELPRGAGLDVALPQAPGAAAAFAVLPESESAPSVVLPLLTVISVTVPAAGRPLTNVSPVPSMVKTLPLAVLEKLLEFDPDDGFALLSLADHYKSEGNMEKSEDVAAASY